MLRRNLRLESGEIDIVARDGDGVALIEVKTVRRSGLIDPTDKMDERKLRRYKRLFAEYFSIYHKQAPWRGRIDFIGVVLEPRPRIAHYRDITGRFE